MSLETELTESASALTEESGDYSEIEVSEVPAPTKVTVFVNVDVDSRVAPLVVALNTIQGCRTRTSGIDNEGRAYVSFKSVNPEVPSSVLRDQVSAFLARNSYPDALVEGRKLSCAVADAWDIHNLIVAGFSDFAVSFAAA